MSNTRDERPVNGILYVLRSGWTFRLVPHDLPAWGTLYDYFRTWRNDGTWDEIQKSLLKQVRQKEGRDEGPSAAVIDSQSIKTSATNGTEKGFDKGKLIWGRKRHALVDTQGNLMEVKVTAASASDLAGSKKLLEPLKSLFPRMKLVWGDSHYGGTLVKWLDSQLGWKVEVVHGLGTVPDADTETPNPKEKSSKGGTSVLPRRLRRRNNPVTLPPEAVFCRLRGYHCSFLP